MKEGANEQLEPLVSVHAKIEFNSIRPTLARRLRESDILGTRLHLFRQQQLQKQSTIHRRHILLACRLTGYVDTLAKEPATTQTATRGPAMWK